uniref:C2H2-type domain-containing protein n=1 Tax=Timema genevievae TaxID=629358 RepID=A0A7R9PID2_TIMGE|nr:unnamed protein product [Timema genevievae]
MEDEQIRNDYVNHSENPNESKDRNEINGNNSSTNASVKSVTSSEDSEEPQYDDHGLEVITCCPIIKPEPDEDSDSTDNVENYSQDYQYSRQNSFELGKNGIEDNQSSVPIFFSSSLSKKPYVKVCYECDSCKKIFSHKSDLDAHKSSKEGCERLHSCRHCGRTFIMLRQLECHMRSHTGKNAYICNTCGLSFSFKKSLKTHSYLHKNEVFTCDCCGKKFLTPSNLKYVL